MKYMKDMYFKYMKFTYFKLNYIFKMKVIRMTAMGTILGKVSPMLN